MYTTSTCIPMNVICVLKNISLCFFSPFVCVSVGVRVSLSLDRSIARAPASVGGTPAGSAVVGTSCAGRLRVCAECVVDVVAVRVGSHHDHAES